MLSLGASIETQTLDGCTPLLIASQYGSLEHIQLLIAKGANLKVNDKKGHGVLAYADTPEKVRLLVKKGVSVKGNQNQLAPIFTQVASSNSECVRELVKLGASLYDKCDGLTLLHCCNNAEMVKTLVHLGCSPNSLSSDLLSPMAAHLMNNNLEVAKALQENGAALNSSLFLSKQVLDNPVAVKMLLEFGVKADELSDDLAPIMMVRNRECLKLMIDAGANVNCKRKDGTTALHLQASRATDPEIIKDFIKAGANVNATTKEGTTPLFHSSSAANTKVLIDAGASIHISISSGTPLHLVAMNDKVEADLLSLLVKSGLNPNARTNIGITPLMVFISFIFAINQH